MNTFRSGAYAAFGPGQFKNLYPRVTQPACEGTLHFIGEATSAEHA
jgi:monoamine oxidase